jgi:epoxyqueuosine reductase
MSHDKNLNLLANSIKHWGIELGFQQVSIADIHLPKAELHLNDWLPNDWHGEMSYMGKHGSKRSRPAELIPGTLRVISTRMDYLPPQTNRLDILNSSSKAYISRYALGRDYHKLVRKRLVRLISRIRDHLDETIPDEQSYSFRAFTDSAPVLEKALAESAGLGWIGKNTLLLNKSAGSWFFLGEIYTDLPLPIDNEPGKSHCGTCTACLEICPTQAFTGPYQLDARRCISYLTIEHKSSIPLELRSLMGNRVFGCDDCQLVCPWNRFARHTHEEDFKPRHNLNDIELLTLFEWSREEFLQNTAGSAIRRAGYECWVRNLAIALGNAPADQRIVSALIKKSIGAGDMLAEHINWALAEQNRKAGGD